LYNLKIEGILEFDDSIDHYLEVEMIFINGGQLIIGWESNPMKKDVKIVLTGKKSSLNFMLPDGFSLIGGKGIGVYGGLDIHGVAKNVSWTYLNETVHVGSNLINLAVPVDWNIGDEIMITTTTYIANQNEIFKINSISNDLKEITLNSSVQYEHIGFSETLFSPNEQTYKIAAAVGVLSRNIKIIGGEYLDQEIDHYGFRIIVSDYSAIVDGINTLYKGFARISNVEFQKFGQFGFESQDDSSYGLLFTNLGDYNWLRPSYVKSSTFHHGYSCAIGIFKSNSIPIESNVIYRTISFGLNIQGHSNRIRKNLVAMNFWPGTKFPHLAELDKTYNGAINLNEADSYVVESNYVAGSERIGINYRGDLCSGQSLTNKNHSVSYNTVIGSLAGVLIMSKAIISNDLTKLTCVKIDGFNVFKSVHWGIYYEGEASLQVTNNLLADNQINFFSHINGPSSVNHVVGSKTVQLSNSIIIGQSPSYNCSNDLKPNDLNFKQATKIKSFGAGSKYDSKIGVVWSNFLQSSNKIPEHPFPEIMAYNQINGLMTITNTTFAHFDLNCDGNYDAMIAGSKDNDDGQHPINIKGLKLNHVNNASKIWLFRPNIGKINPTDCIDMDCDGKNTY